MQLTVMTLRFRADMINALRLKLNVRFKKKKAKVISLKILKKSKILKEINVIKFSNKD